MTSSSLAHARPSVGPPRKSPLGILRNAGWLTGTRLAGDFVSFGLFVVLSRYFGPAGIGEFAYGFAIATFVTILVGFGLDDFGVRELSRLPADKGRQLLGKLVASQLALLGIASVALGVFLLVTRASPTVAGIIIVLGAQQAFLTIARTFFAPAYAQQAMVSPALMEVSCRVVGMLITLMLVVVFHTSLATALVGYPMGAVALLAFAIRSSIQRVGGLSLRIGWREALRLMRTSWPFGASEMVYLFYTRADLVILTWIRGNAAAGIYASGLKFFEVSTLPVFFLGFAAYPALSRLFERRSPTMAPAAGRLFLSALMIAGLVAWGMVFVVPSVLVPLLGDQFASAGPVVRIMAVLVVLTAVEATATRVLLAVHLQVIRFKLQLASTVLNVVLDLLLIPTFGIMGAIVATAVALFTVDAFYLRALRSRVASAPVNRALVSFLVPLLAALAAGAIATVLHAPEWLIALGSLGIFLVAALLSGVGTIAREGLRGQMLGSLPTDR